VDIGRAESKRGDTRPFLYKRHFDDVKLTSLLRSVVQVVMILFIIMLVTLHVKINCTKYYENLLNFVKVMPKILVVTFVSDMV